jgi:microcystin-dependent protein
MSYNNPITILYIIISILVIVILYLLYKTRKIKSDTGKIETFAVSEDIKKAITEIYNADIDAIRNLSGIAAQITTNSDTLTLPAANTKILGSTEITGNLYIGGNIMSAGSVNFTRRSDMLMNTIPTGFVLAHYGGFPLKAWAPCDGKYYVLDAEQNAIEVLATAPGARLTPDLRSRFIIGASGTADNQQIWNKGQQLTSRPYLGWGGEENVTLTVEQMPSHSHTTNISRNGKGHCNDASPNTFECGGGGGDYGYNTVTISNTGGTQAHNNMPPYFSLIYYMKL